MYNNNTRKFPKGLICMVYITVIDFSSGQVAHGQ